MDDGKHARSWRDDYRKLREFAAATEGIRLAPRSLTVPSEARGEFFGLVEQVQLVLARDVLGDEAKRVREAASRCADVRKRMLASSGLGAFHLAPTLESLLADADKTLAKPAFALVLDAVQSGLDEGALEEAAKSALPPFAASMFRNAYEAWAYFGVVEALGPAKFYAVSSPDTEEVHAVPAEEVWASSQATSPERRIPEAVFETKDHR